VHFVRFVFVYKITDLARSQINVCYSHPMSVPDTLNNKEIVQLELISPILDVTISPVNAFEREVKGRKLRR
jgi:hypothetical protein